MKKSHLPVAVRASHEVMALKRAAAEVVFPMPISPTHSTFAPEVDRRRAVIEPTSSAACSWLSVMAASVRMFPDPHRTCDQCVCFS